MNNALPNRCATTNMDGKPIMIENGETGYYPVTDPNFSVEAWNHFHNVTEEEVIIMTSASMFGWDILAVKDYVA